MAIPKDLVAASATPLVLSILERGDSYGYEIIQRVRESSGGRMEWSEGMLYPILHRLERKKLVQSYWGEADTGRRRKYYRLKRSGSKALAEQLAAWKDAARTLEHVRKGVAWTS